MFTLFLCWFYWHYDLITQAKIYYRIISLNKSTLMTFEIARNNEVGMEDFRDFLRWSTLVCMKLWHRVPSHSIHGRKARVAMDIQSSIHKWMLFYYIYGNIWGTYVCGYFDHYFNWRTILNLYRISLTYIIT